MHANLTIELYEGVKIVSITIDQECVESNVEVCERLVRLDKSAKAISSATRWSAAASLVPVPYIDLVALASVQAKLVYDISNIYGQEYKKQTVNGLVSVLLGTLVPSTASNVAASALVKMIPGYGSVIGAVSLAALGSAATYAIGRVFVRHFENGGTLDNFSAENVREELKREFVAAQA